MASKASLPSLLVLLPALAGAEPRLPSVARLGVPAAVETPRVGPAMDGSVAASLFTRDQLASYFAEGTLAEAHRHYRQRRYRKVIDVLDGDERLPARWLHTMSKARLGRHEEAGIELSSLAADWPDLSDRLSFEAGKAFARAHQWEDAAVRLREVDVGSIHFTDARAQLADLLAARGEFAGAVEALEPLTLGKVPGATPADRSRAFLKMADLERRQGHADRAREVLLEGWAALPETAVSRLATRTANVRAAPPELRVRRAESLLELHFNRQAVAMLRGVAEEPPDPVGCRAAFVRGMAMRKERSHGAAIRTLRPAIDACRQSDLRPMALWTLAYSEGVVEPQDSAATYERLAEEYPGDALADNALLAAAKTRLGRGEVMAGLAVLDRLLERYPLGDKVADALFERFWTFRAERSYQPALEAISRVETLPRGLIRADQLRKARYWRARTLGDLGRTEESAALQERLAIDGAASYYGLLARSRLVEEAPTVADRVLEAIENESPEADPLPLDASELVRDRHFRAGLELLRLGERGATLELFAVDRRALQEESVRLLFHVLDESGHPSYARVVARAYLREGHSAPKRLESRRIYEAAYPRLFHKLIDRHSKAAGVDPELMAALIREESAFNPRARSTTGAIGLAQLMPETAWRVGRSLRFRRVTRKSLFSPGRNIRLGSAYLGGLQRQFDGNAFLAVASYNAGPHKVNQWVRRFSDADLDEWVEQIPIDETREYVKKVLGSYATYELLSGEGQPVLALGGER